MFRIRTRADGKGNVVEANVGWIRDDIRVVPTSKSKGMMIFSYYYNPDPKSRSLEPKEIADRQGR